MRTTDAYLDMMCVTQSKTGHYANVKQLQRYNQQQSRFSCSADAAQTQTELDPTQVLAEAKYTANHN